MPVITNTGRAGRGFSVIDPMTLGVKLLHLNPGESVRAVLADPACPVCRGMQDAGDVDFGGALAALPRAVPGAAKVPPGRQADLIERFALRGIVLQLGPGGAIHCPRQELLTPADRVVLRANEGGIKAALAATAKVAA